MVSTVEYLMPVASAIFPMLCPSVRSVKMRRTTGAISLATSSPSTRA